MIGKTLGHYQIIEEIGSGGMGVVYKARDMHLDRFVALKTLPPQRVEEPERKRRFVQEAKAASALNHPNIVHIYDISSDSAVDYIAMEYVDGQTLGERIARRGLRLAEILKYAIQIADALAKAHSAGIIHRDLKPSNIMVNDDGTVKLLDFGLAKLTEVMQSDAAASPAAASTEEQPLTENGIIVGTVAYMSPEQAEGRNVDARSDIFSFGSVLYEMVAGRRAFQEATKIATLSAILSKEPNPLSAEIPHDLEKAIARCLRKDPARRFQNMADLRVTLEELKEESDSQNQTSLAPGRGVAVPSTGFLLKAAGLLVLLLVCAAGLALYFFGYRPGFQGGSSLAEIGPGGKLTLLASSEGGLSMPAISPDGKMLAYLGESQGHFDLFVGRVAGGERVKLTDDDAEEGWPCFSPDGERIVYTRFDPETTRPAIWIVQTLGGQAVRVVSDATQAAWSPDGERLAFVSRRPAEGDVLSIAEADGRNVSSLMNGDAAYPFFRSPSWSPDGNSLAVTRSSGGVAGEMWLVPLDGSPPRRLSNDPPGIFSYRPLFTEDGRGLVHVSNRAGATNLWMLTLADGQMVRLTSGPGPDTMPSVARDGSIAFSNTRERCALVVHNLVDGRRRDILTHSSYLWAPSFSPSGLELAFSRAEQDGIWHIWVAQVNGGAPRQLTSGDLPEVYPRFTPDGSAVIYHTWSAGPDRIWRVPQEGGPPDAITPARQDDDQYGDMSPDGQKIVFARTEESITRIYVSDIHVGEARRLTEMPATLPRWSPDGQFIAFGLSRGYLDGIWVMRSDGTGVRKLSETGGWPVWWPDGSRLGYQTIGKDGAEEVCVVPAAGGPPEALSSIQFSGTNNAFDISPDGKQLATSNCEVISSDIWLLEPQRSKE